GYKGISKVEGKAVSRLSSPSFLCMLSFPPLFPQSSARRVLFSKTGGEGRFSLAGNTKIMLEKN
ncbi:MAG: hypothetical protein NTX30_06785, partial [Deltaproteobacteria bacterium]|nr:hypothetical protein [Deltaproteobacteria bacterium]